MNRQEFEDTTRRYREEMFRMYANQSMDPPPKPTPQATRSSSAPPPQPSMPQSSSGQFAAAPQLTPQSEPQFTPQAQPSAMPPSMPQSGPQSGLQSPTPPQDTLQNASAPPDTPQDVSASHTGQVRVMVSTARGARPVPGASVMITQEHDGVVTLMATRTTNDSGETGAISLPAPPPSDNQQHPQAAFYDISVYAPGYYREHSSRVPVFPNVLSLQSFDLIPIPAGMTDWKVPSDLTFTNEMQAY